MDGSGSTQSKRTSAEMSTKVRADYRDASASARQAPSTEHHAWSRLSQNPQTRGDLRNRQPLRPTHRRISAQSSIFNTRFLPDHSQGFCTKLVNFQLQRSDQTTPTHGPVIASADEHDILTVAPALRRGEIESAFAEVLLLQQARASTVPDRLLPQSYISSLHSSLVVNFGRCRGLSAVGHLVCWVDPRRQRSAAAARVGASRGGFAPPGAVRHAGGWRNRRCCGRVRRSCRPAKKT